VEHGRILAGPLEWVAAKVVDMRPAHRHRGFEPHTQAACALLDEGGLPVANPQRKQIAVVAPVEEGFAGILLDLSLQERQQVVAVDVDLERSGAGLVAPFQLLDGVRNPGRRRGRWHAGVMLYTGGAHY